jgi:hypothetical protein
MRCGVQLLTQSKISLAAHMRYRRETEVEPEDEVPKWLIFYRGEITVL